MQNQRILNLLLQEYKVQPVGKNYIDCIIVEKIVAFIEELTKINIYVNVITWWCYTSNQNIRLYGCPHGCGGPKSVYFDGWFSEMCHLPLYEPSDNIHAIDYIENGLKNEPFYSPCLRPGLWLSDKMQGIEGTYDEIRCI